MAARGVCLSKPVSGLQGEPGSLGAPTVATGHKETVSQIVSSYRSPKLPPVAPGTPQGLGDPLLSHYALGRCFVADALAPAATRGEPAAPGNGAVFVTGVGP